MTIGPQCIGHWGCLHAHMLEANFLVQSLLTTVNTTLPALQIVLRGRLGLTALSVPEAFGALAAKTRPSMHAAPTGSHLGVPSHLLHVSALKVGMSAGTPQLHSVLNWAGAGLGSISYRPHSISNTSTTVF